MNSVSLWGAVSPAGANSETTELFLLHRVISYLIYIYITSLFLEPFDAAS